MAGRAANDFFGLFVNIKIINIQVINIFIDEATALNRANEFDTTIGSCPSEKLYPDGKLKQ